LEAYTGGILVEDPAASDADAALREATTPEFAAVLDKEDGVEFAAAIEELEELEELAAAVEVLDTAEELLEAAEEVNADELEDVATVEIRLTLEDGNPWLAVCVLLDELYATVDELYDWLAETNDVLITEAVTVTKLVDTVAEQAREEVREMCCLWVLRWRLVNPW
jgi:hypothetical protein